MLDNCALSASQVVVFAVFCLHSYNSQIIASAVPYRALGSFGSWVSRQLSSVQGGIRKIESIQYLIVIISRGRVRMIGE
jgi:hypothetical protein